MSKMTISKQSLYKSKGCNCIPSIDKEAAIQSQNRDKVAKAIIQLKKGEQNGRANS